MIVNEAMHELEMLNDPFLGRGTELPTEMPFENEDDGCCSGILKNSPFILIDSD